ncbi:putative THOC5 family protein-like [Teratosphaeria destructans]|uniref:THOC5 family protein-like n=1 Tax=Teratosphaeria destructans TaxID=418781 RepID=A0A9W7SZN6_9PEZI|nr:putative THOC5 family protein-like [Teratosphaeria destructans]
MRWSDMAAENIITDPQLLSALDAAAKARAQSLAILDLIEEYHASDDPTQSPADGEHILERQLKLSRQQKLLNAHLAKLRGLNRKAILGTRTTKQATAEARQEIDGLHLQLQNLYYEQRHLRGEISGCENYEHRYRTLPMIDVEDFLAAHPEHDQSSEHDLTIARIQDEHVARQELEDQRQKLQKKKEALVKETNVKKEELVKFDNEVEKWLNLQANPRKVLEAHEKKIQEAREKDLAV